MLLCWPPLPRPYRAPELLLGAKWHGIGVDLWAAGAMFCDLLGSPLLGEPDSEMHAMSLLFETLGMPTVKRWPVSVNAMKR